MKIEQNNTEFKPITITLETVEETEALWDIIEYYDGVYNEVANHISDAFCSKLTVYT